MWVITEREFLKQSLRVKIIEQLNNLIVPIEYYSPNRIHKNELKELKELNNKNLKNNVNANKLNEGDDDNLKEIIIKQVCNPDTGHLFWYGSEIDLNVILYISKKINNSYWWFQRGEQNLICLHHRLKSSDLEFAISLFNSNSDLKTAQPETLACKLNTLLHYERIGEYRIIKPINFFRKKVASKK